MYVHPFLAGIVCTIVTEILIVVVAAFVHLYKTKGGKR